MKVLITGIGITGKSAFRELFAKIFSDGGLSVKEFDADYDLQKIPNDFLGKTIYIIEDIHGTTEEAVLPLSAYDLILYLRPKIFTHILFWLGRMIIWFGKGIYSWDQKNGWRGTGRRYDFRNIIPILKEFLRDFRNRKIWIDRDMKAISASQVPFRIVQSKWKSPKTIKFCVHLSIN